MEIPSQGFPNRKWLLDTTALLYSKGTDKVNWVIPFVFGHIREFSRNKP